jgi:predicted 3-demethylubiquinone-9 3-methyltransferase (glyoxalase superfamily)
MQKLTTFLMFVGDKCGRAEEAIRFYTSLFPDSRVDDIERWALGEPGGREGLVKRASFHLAGQTFMASENTIEHSFTFTPAISVFVTCESEAEQDRLYDRLLEGGAVLMEMADYGFSKRFAWVSDRYSVSWQLNLD